MTFRKISLMFLGVALVMGLGAGSVKAEYPDKPITLILPLGAGGSHDRNARVFTSVIPQFLGNAMIVKLMPGASGQVGTAAAAASAMALGGDGVGMNTAIAEAKDPVSRAHAMRLAGEAGRLAYLAGRMGKKRYADPSSPLGGLI